MAKILPVLTMVEAHKREQVQRIFAEWRKLDFGEYVPQLVVGIDDSDEELNTLIGQEMGSWSPLAVYALGLEEIPGVPELDLLVDVNEFAWYHRMAVKREALRDRALADLPAFDFALWLDADMTPSFPDGVLKLIAFLEMASSRYGPQAVAGMACGRVSGTPVIQGLAGQPMLSMEDINWGHPRMVVGAGYGGVLVTRRALTMVSWEHYGTVRAHREQLAPPNNSPIGEDNFWYGEYARILNCPMFVHSGVPLRHWHLDGSFWEMGADLRTHALVPNYNISQVDPNKQVVVHNPTPDVFEQPAYRLRLAPGEECRVSPDLATRLTRDDGVLKAGPCPIPQDIADQVAALASPRAETEGSSLRDRVQTIRARAKAQNQPALDEAAG